jgi:hypothetical protein
MMKGRVMRTHRGTMATPIRWLPWNVPEALVVVGDAQGILKRAERWGGVRLTRGGSKGGREPGKRAWDVTVAMKYNS